MPLSHSTSLLYNPLWVGTGQVWHSISQAHMEHSQHWIACLCSHYRFRYCRGIGSCCLFLLDSNVLLDSRFLCKWLSFLDNSSPLGTVYIQQGLLMDCKFQQGIPVGIKCHWGSNCQWDMVLQWNPPLGCLVIELLADNRILPSNPL